ncbi:MAG: hypothetical protein SFV15_04905 [Polyangiaceae bacterium]|nr:hypothetical protein [Polyangiaceae bacterium]
MARAARGFAPGPLKVPGGLAWDERGSVFVEYVVVLTVFSLVCVAALVAVGLPLLRHFQAQMAWLLLPVP